MFVVGDFPPVGGERADYSYGISLENIPLDLLDFQSSNITSDWISWLRVVASETSE